MVEEIQSVRIAVFSPDSDEMFLFLRDKHRDIDPCKWMMPGGKHLIKNYGEDFLATAILKMQEDTGLDLTNDRERFRYFDTNLVRQGNFAENYALFLTQAEIREMKVNLHGCIRANWLKPTEIQGLINNHGFALGQEKVIPDMIKDIHSLRPQRVFS